MNKLIVLLWTILIFWFIGGLYWASSSSKSDIDSKNISNYTIKLNLGNSKLTFNSAKFENGSSKPIIEENTLIGLDKIANYLIENNDKILIISGYALENEQASNAELAMERAENIANYFYTKKVPPSKIKIKTFTFDDKKYSISTGNVFFSIK
jgi:outer membrane protein OmpA-like peptidoglycan-associated protein